MAKGEMMNDSNEYRFDSHASSVAFGQNVSGTYGKIDTPLTQPRSGDVPMTDFTKWNRVPQS
jgi:hypothetical protein